MKKTSSKYLKVSQITNQYRGNHRKLNRLRQPITPVYHDVTCNKLRFTRNYEIITHLITNSITELYAVNHDRIQNLENLLRISTASFVVL